MKSDDLLEAELERLEEKAESSNSGFWGRFGSRESR